ncbi:PAS domain-containing protein [Oceanibium sediminis]|uniref:PAS domain-containing protein n=1 Tax=Oceanibium sediminis TaxID=2026339 RepID=UPI000DD38231|nr:PAS domain-containing protein [Oceanibium sediminis]
MSHHRLRLHQADRQDRRGLMAALDATQCLAWFAPDSRVLEANPNLQALLGWPHQVLCDMSYQMLMGEKGRHDAYYATHWQRILDAEVRSEERELVAADGNTLWCAMTYAPIRKPDGTPQRVLAIVLDLSPWNRNPKEGLARIY